MARRVQRASCIYRPWTDDAVLPQPPTHQGLCFGLTLRWTPVGGRPCSSARRRRCPVSPFRPRPLSVASFLYQLQGFTLFYPRPLRPLRASAPLRKAPTARQPTAHTGACTPSECFLLRKKKKLKIKQLQALPYTSQSLTEKMAKYEINRYTALHAETSYRHGVNC